MFDHGTYMNKWNQIVDNVQALDFEGKQFWLRQDDLVDFLSWKVEGGFKKKTKAAKHACTTSILSRTSFETLIVSDARSSREEKVGGMQALRFQGLCQEIGMALQTRLHSWNFPHRSSPFVQIHLVDGITKFLTGSTDRTIASVGLTLNSLTREATDTSVSGFETPLVMHANGANPTGISPLSFPPRVDERSTKKIYEQIMKACMLHPRSHNSVRSTSTSSTPLDPGRVKHEPGMIQIQWYQEL